MTHLADTPKKIGSRKVFGACFFQLYGPWTLGAARATPNVKGISGRDCRGTAKGGGLVEP